MKAMLIIALFVSGVTFAATAQSPNYRIDWVGLDTYIGTEYSITFCLVDEAPTPGNNQAQDNLCFGSDKFRAKDEIAQILLTAKAMGSRVTVSYDNKTCVNGGVPASTCFYSIAQIIVR